VALTAALEKKGWTVMKLAEELDATYEHVRKIVRGLGFPSKRMLRDICGMLDLNFEQMNKLAIADRIEKRYGTIPTELAGKNPRFTKVERLLPNLTEDQFQILLAQLEGFDRSNRRARQ
jgi:transcriptional regulator with XRE-family HTH domain